MSWRHVLNWPAQLTAIHAVLLRNNRLVMWGFGEPNSNLVCKAWVVNLDTWEFFQINCTVNNIFCAGHSMLADERVLVAGGTDSTQGENGEGFGTLFATLLVPDGTPAGAHWEAAQPMGTVEPDDARWYPTNTTLPDDRPLVLSGTTHLAPPIPPGTRVYNKKVQLYVPASNLWLTALIEQQLPLYPNMYLIPPGYVFYAGRAIEPNPPGDQTLALRLSDLTWHLVTSGFTDGGIGEHNSSCMFAPGKVLRSGGDSLAGAGASNLAATIDLSNWQDGQPASWQTAAPMNHARRDHTLVALPNGLALAMGGQATKDYSLPVTTPEVLDPSNPTVPWVNWDAPPDPSFDPRTYHSIAFLLLSGRIFIAGGQKTQTTTYPSGDIYTPPVIANESERPVINTAPASIQYGVQFSVDRNGGSFGSSIRVKSLMNQSEQPRKEK
ncbi:MAG: hypothetical protein AB1725_11340 [Armatimonadota bacterium]